MAAALASNWPKASARKTSRGKRNDDHFRRYATRFAAAGLHREIHVRNRAPAHQSRPRSPTIPSPTPSTAPAAPYHPNSALPEDLRISWSWPHLILFLFFTGASFVVVQTALFFYYGPRQPIPKEELERYLLNKPQFIFGTNLLWYAAVFFFLYVTLSVLRDSPFWSSLGMDETQI